jgi:hypothetical protein
MLHWSTLLALALSIMGVVLSGTLGAREREAETQEGS